MVEPNPDPRRPQRSRMTFSLAALMLLMLMCSVLSALLAGMMRHGGGQQYGYVLASVVAPVGVMIALSLLLHFRKQRYRRRPRHDDEKHRP